MLLFFPVNCFNQFERPNIFFLPKSVNSRASYILCIMYANIFYTILDGNSAGTQKEMTVY